MNKSILILGAHQSHVGRNAGGYVRIAELLKCKPKNVSVRIIDIRPSIYQSIKNNIEIIEVPYPRLFQLLGKRLFALSVLIERIYVAVVSYRMGVEILSKNEVDVIYCPVGELLHLYLSAVLLKIRFPNTKLVVDILNFYIHEQSILQLFSEFKMKKNTFVNSLLLAIVHKASYVTTKITINYCDYIFTVSQNLKTQLQTVYRKKSIDYTPSGVSSENTNIRSNTTKKYLGIYIGRLTEQKGIFNCLELWSQLRKKYTYARFCLAGQIDETVRKELDSEIERLHLSKHIDLFFFIDEKTKARLLLQSSIFFHLAKYEPLFPVIGILEAMSNGLPCVVFDMPVISDNDKKLLGRGLIVLNSVNRDNINNAIYKYMNDPNLQKGEIASRVLNYSKRFAWPTVLAQEWKILTTL